MTAHFRLLCCYNICTTASCSVSKITWVIKDAVHSIPCVSKSARIILHAIMERTPSRACELLITADSAACLTARRSSSPWIHRLRCAPFFSPGGSVFHCDRKHPHNHRRRRCEVQLRPAHPPLRPHSEGQRSEVAMCSTVRALVVTQLVVVVVRIQSWEVESDRVRQKLLSLIGRIGREARSETTTGKVGPRFPLWQSLRTCW